MWFRWHREPMRWVEVGSLLDLGEQPFADLPPRVLPGPVHGGRQKSS